MSMKHGQHYWRELKTTSIKKVKLFSQHHEEKIYTTNNVPINFKIINTTLE